MGALIAAARRALEWAREQARRWVEGWRRRVADLVARARGAVAAARARGRALLQSVQARGRALLAGAGGCVAPPLGCGPAAGCAMGERSAGAIIALSGFSRPAQDWAKGKPIHLINGDDFLKMWQKVSQRRRKV